MICWQCNNELFLVYEDAEYLVRLFHCEGCDRWYEMRKEKVKINSSVPIKFFEIEAPADNFRNKLRTN